MSRMPSAQYPIFLEPDTLLPVRPPRPRARQRLTPSEQWEPGSALVPLMVAAPALLVAAILAAQSAPEALRLLAALNVPAAVRAFSWALFSAGLGIVGATLAMLLLAGHGTRRPVGGRAWASRHLEHRVQARQGQVGRATEPVVVVRRQDYGPHDMPAITPLPLWEASEAIPRSMLAWHARHARMDASLQRQARASRTTRKLSAPGEYLPLLPMPA